jgi:hypothetical protein
VLPVVAALKSERERSGSTSESLVKNLVYLEFTSDVRSDYRENIMLDRDNAMMVVNELALGSKLAEVVLKTSYLPLEMKKALAAVSPEPFLEISVSLPGLRRFKRVR